MTTFTINDENNITAFATAEAAYAASTTPFDLFTNQEELAELLAGWPAERLLATYNSLPGLGGATPERARSLAPASLGGLGRAAVNGGRTRKAN